jgi:hypothetical protein
LSRIAGAALMLALAAAPTRLAAQDDTTSRKRPSVWFRPVASLVVPGSGQLLAGRDRAAVFMAAELYLVARAVQLNREAVREGDRFRSLAFDVARRAFSTERRDTVFEYYETMERFPESGSYDAQPGAGFTPEPDASTYNGSVWLLARRTYWEDPAVPPDPTSPEYQRALQFYQSRAVGEGYRWSWHGASLEHEVFRQTIRRSDSAFRRAQNQLGLLLANHVLSAVDALIASRLAAAAGRPATVHSALFGPAGASFELSIAF